MHLLSRLSCECLQNRKAFVSQQDRCSEGVGLGMQRINSVVVWSALPGVTFNDAGWNVQNEQSKVNC